MTAIATRRPDIAAHARLGPTLVVLALTAILVNAQNYTLIPLFTMLADDWRVNVAEVTWASSAIFVGYAVGFLVLGPFAARFDRRGMMVAGLAATAVTTLLVPLASGLGAAIVLRVLQGFTAAAFAPAAFAYIASKIEPRHRTLVLSAVVSGFLAAAVAGQVGAQLLAPAAGWRAVFGAAATLLVIMAVVVHFALPGDPAPGAGSGGILRAYRSMPGLLFGRRLAPLYGATLTNLGVFVAAYAGLQIVGGLDNAQLLGLRAGALPAIIAVPLLAPWLRRAAPARRAAVSILLMAAAAAAIGLLHPGTVGTAALLLIFVAGVTSGASALNETIGERAGESRTTAIPLFTFVLMAGASAAPPLAAVLADAGFTPLFLGIAAISAVSAGLVTFSRASAQPG